MRKKDLKMCYLYEKSHLTIVFFGALMHFHMEKTAIAYHQIPLYL